MKDAFLSYARDDEDNVRSLYWSLCRFGVATWVDFEDLEPGQDWQMAIEKAIRESRVFVACLSRKSVSKRGYVQAELKQALSVLEEMPEGAVYIIPVRLEECEIPHSLSRLHYVDLFKDGARSRLVNSIVAHLRDRQKDKGPTKGVLNFVTIKVDYDDLNWAEVPLPEEPVLFDFEYNQYLNLIEFVFDADLVLDVTVRNLLDKSVIITHIGVEIPFTAHVVHAYGFPGAAKIMKTDSYEIEMPNLISQLPKSDRDLSSIDRLPSVFKIPSPLGGFPTRYFIEPQRIDESAECSLIDPIYLEPHAPYRFSVRLQKYTKHIPNQTIIRLYARTDQGTGWAHLIRTFSV